MELSKLTFLSFFIFFATFFNSSAQDFLVFNQQRTLSYDSVIIEYQKLDKMYKQAKLIEYGYTDVGKPLHLFVISSDGEFDPVKIKKKNRRIMLINNGIHSGEPEGVDASLWLAADLLSNKDDKMKLLDSTVLCIIPIYNIGGALMRSSYNRANQIFPLEHGFRGNARNLDLNRDFVKADSYNARSFAQIFHAWNPDVFVDTHTTDGSEHQYVITLIHSNPRFLSEPLGNFMGDVLMPEFHNKMTKIGFEMAPYVQTKDWVVDDPSTGIFGFYDSPKYSTGYATLFNTISFLTETHSYKTYDLRVKATYAFLEQLLGLVKKYHFPIGQYRAAANKKVSNQSVFEINFETDTTQVDSIWFKGYEALWKNSSLTGAQTFGYDLEKPYNKKIPFYNTLVTTAQIEAPDYYIVPFAWHEVIERLRLNNVKFEVIQRDTACMAEVYFIDKFEFSNYQTGGHRPINNIELRTEKRWMKIYKGDIKIPVNQDANKYIVQMLEPKGADSFFQWNFFDEILERREYFSPYGFEPRAVEYLKNHPELKEKFDQKRKIDPEFANNHYIQLKFIYDNSPFAEPSFMRYPVLRIMNGK